jgi:putative tryptophan/tyrosine transport system substrate-binding protein
MRRREFIAGLGSAAATWPKAARAQQATRVRTIGALMAQAENDPAGPPRIAVMRETLRKAGWSDQQLEFETIWVGNNLEAARSYAAELVRRRVDVIVATSTPALAAARELTSVIPIVFVNVTDPLGSGPGSLSKTTGNVTGFTNFETAIGAKWLEILRDALPGLTNVGVIFNPDTAPGGGAAFFATIDMAARAVGIEASEETVRIEADIDAAMLRIGSSRRGCFIVVPDTFTTANRQRLFQASMTFRVPGMFPFSYFSSEGGLLSYGPNILDLYRRASTYIDRILKGEKVTELPVQLPLKYDLVPRHSEFDLLNARSQ